MALIYFSPGVKGVQVRLDRWLEVQRIVGSVFYHKVGSTAQPAQNGVRLQQVGDEVRTGDRSSTALVIDLGTGFVSLAENTQVQVSGLRTLPTGGRITRLKIKQGQARLQIRPLTNPNSQVEIQTPAGVSGVRGTTFGVSAQQDGKMGVATLEGSVATTAQGQTVLVNSGFQSLIVPGLPPTPPTPLQENTRLDLLRLAAIDTQTAQVSGQTEAVNLLQIQGKVQSTDVEGRFEVNVPLPANRRLEAIVTTPLGKRQVYELAVP